VTHANEPTTRVLLIRHGQSEWNAQGRWQGHADPPLSEAGEAQARLASYRLGMFDAIHCSDLQRASHTAEIIAAQLGVGPVEVDDRWRERGVGEWTGLTRAEIDERWPGVMATHEWPDSFEPEDVVRDRALEALRHLYLTLGTAEALVVTHGGVIRILERLLGAEDGLIPNVAGRWFIVEPSRIVLGERVELLSPDELPATVPNHL
jgi:broad specificity phosphatase PhoE